MISDGKISTQIAIWNPMEKKEVTYTMAIPLEAV
jgi:hypothetical protein